MWAYANDDPQCPDQTGHTWKYYAPYGKDWKDAGDGLVVKCAG